MKDSDTALINMLYQIGVIQFGEFTFKSGQTSNLYINLRKIIAYPVLLRQIATAMWEKTRTSHYDLVCGVPYTALPIATCLALDHNIPMLMRRKEKKEYGTKATIEGVFTAGQSCLIIEDVITTGSSIIETAQELQAANLIIKEVVVLIDRNQGGRENLEQYFTVHSILSLNTMLAYLLQSALVKPDERIAIERFLIMQKNVISKQHDFTLKQDT